MAVAVPVSNLRSSGFSQSLDVGFVHEQYRGRTKGIVVRSHKTVI